MKEFAEEPDILTGGGPFDPYVRIRGKIDKAATKFREYEDESCSLVLYNDKLNLADICTPFVVLGAMLGNLSFRTPLPDKEIAGPVKQFFGEGGRLINPHTKQPQMTRMSAVIALEQFPVGQREFQISVARKEREENRRYSWEEFCEFLRSQSEMYTRRVLRVIVYENPFAKRRLPDGSLQVPSTCELGQSTASRTSADSTLGLILPNSRPLKANSVWTLDRFGPKRRRQLASLDFRRPSPNPPLTQLQ